MNSGRNSWSANAEALSAIDFRTSEGRQQEIREQILGLCREYMDARGNAPLVPGSSVIPASTKILDADDLVNLVDSSLDLWLTTGRFAESFEARLAKIFEQKYARLTVSGSAANLLALTALTSPKLNKRRITPGSEIITVAAGFPTTVFPIIQNRCIPVFVDVDLATANIDVSKLEAALSPTTKAVMIAHTLGNPFNLDVVGDFCKRNGLYLIEDCCDALGATYRDRHVGSFGDTASVSFYPAHHITTGEGGAVITNRLSLVKLIESFRDWGRDCWCHTGFNNTCGKRFDWSLGELPHGYDHKFIYSHIGYNLKMTDMQAALGCSQLDKLDWFVERRRANFDKLKELFLERGLDRHFVLPEATPHSNPSWFGFLVSIRDGDALSRRDFVEFVESRKILTRLLFGGNLTKQPAFKDVDYRVVGSLENTDKLMNDGFWIGIWPGLELEHLTYMADTVAEGVRVLSRG